MRVVLDTNVLVSACIKPRGLEAKTVQLVVAGACRLYISGAARLEYRKVLFREKFGAWRESIDLLLGALETSAETVEITTVLQAASDPDDNRFLECADAAQAAYLITGNLKHYPRQWGVTKIVNARQFLAERFPELLPDEPVL